MGDICHSQMHAPESPSDDGFDLFDCVKLLRPALTRIQIVDTATRQIVSDVWSEFDYNLFFATKADTVFSSVLKYKTALDDYDTNETIVLNVDGPYPPSYFYFVEELLKSAQKCEGDVIVMLVRQERLKGFSEMWRRAHLDFYQTQKNRRVKATQATVKPSETPA